MSTAQSDAVADRPSVEDEMAKFKTFASTDGDTSDGAPLPEENATLAARQAQRDQSKAAQAADDKVRADTAAKAEKAAAKPVDLSTEEEDAAVDAAEATKGDTLSDDEREKAVADAIAKKQTDAKGGSKRTVQDRINNYRRQAGAAERRAAVSEGEKAELQRRLAAYEADTLKPATTDTKVVPSAAGKEPDPKDFEFGELDSKFIRALARYEAKQEAEAYKQETAKSSQAAQAQSNLDNLRRQTDITLEHGNAEFDDFEEVVLDGAKQGTWACSAPMLQLITESEVGHRVAYHLATNPKEAARIAGLSPLGQAAAFGRLEAKFSSASSDASTQQDTTQVDPKRVAKTTKAPEPIKTMKGGSGSNQVDGATQDFRAFEAMAQASARRR
jgi:hypothetical protein